MKKAAIIILILLGVLNSRSQTATGIIQGVVRTSAGKPLELASIGLKGTVTGTSTNKEGFFELKNLEVGTYTLVISYLGMESKELNFMVKEGISLSLGEIIVSESPKLLNEVLISSTKSNNEKAVTIGKIAIAPMDLPQSVMTIDKTILEQQQAQRISDVIKNTNGVYLMGASGGYQEEIAGRGFAFVSSNTFKNGARYNNTIMPEMSALERVEIMKGSTAILFGNVAAGGILNLVTKKPKFENGGEVTMRAGSYDYYKPSVDVYGAVNNSKIAAYRLNTCYERSRSFRQGVEAERIYINPSFLVQLCNSTDLTIEGDYLRDNRTADFGVGAINYNLIDIPRERFIGLAWSSYKAEQKSLGATITHHFNSNWQLKSSTNIQDFGSDLYANQRPNSNSQFIKENGDWIRGLQRTQVKERYLISQLDITGKFSTGFVKHNLLFGVDADNYASENLAFNPIARYDTVNVFNPNAYKAHYDIPDITPRTLTKSPVERAGVYVQDLLSITQKIKLLMGVRFSYLETRSDVFTYSNKTNTITTQFDNAFSPRLGLVYQPLTSLSIFVSYANSFSPNTGVDVNGKVLTPSLIDQYEAGIKKDLFHGLLSVNVTGYQIVNSDLAQMSLANGNTNANVKELAGEVTSKGIEVDVMSKEINGFSVISGYSFNDTRYTKSNIYIEGSKLRYNPNHTANLSLYYSLYSTGIRILRNFNVGVGGLYIGERMAGRSTRLTVNNDTYKLIELPAYTNLESSVGYTLKNISLRVKMTNLLNALSYNVHDDNSVNPIAPRQFLTTISIKF